MMCILPESLMDSLDLYMEGLSSNFVETCFQKDKL